MGNCSSCISSDTQINEYGSLENALHIKAPLFDPHASHKIASVSSQVGAKGLNQDTALIYQGFGTEDGALCAVFDGHGLNGHVVSTAARNRLPSLLLHQMKIMEWNQAFVSAFKATDKEIKLLDNVDLSFSGSTAVVVARQGENLAIANLGDSRAILGSLTKNGIQATQLTLDLKPGVPAEMERITKCEGRVYAHETQPHIERVWLPKKDIPGLAMSRAFGDFDMKNYGIIVTPEVSCRRLSSDDLFIVLACDGIWDVLSNDEVVSIVWSAENKAAAAQAVVDEATAAWQRKFPRAKIDDCTAVCLFLRDMKESHSTTSTCQILPSYLNLMCVER